MRPSYTAFIAPLTSSTYLTSSQSPLSVAGMSSITGTYVTDPISMMLNNDFSVMCSTSGAVAPLSVNLKMDVCVQISNDHGNQRGETHNADIAQWFTLPASTQTITAPDSYAYSHPANTFRWMRVSASYTTGSGPLLIQVATKRME